MKYQLIPLLLFIVLVAACSNPPRVCELEQLEQALQFAGDNRAQLEKVLTHYQNDALKLEAAKFLIINMQHYFSWHSPELEAFRDTIRDFAIRNDFPVYNEHNRIVPVVTFKDRITIPNFPRLRQVFDSHVITAKFLIDNIDQSFYAWRSAPWYDAIPFETFLREILPHRAGFEPLEYNWRSIYRAAYQPIIDKIHNGRDIVHAARLVYDSIMNKRWLFDTAILDVHIGANTLFETRIGDCLLLAHYAVYVFRSVGIPVGIDLIVQNPDKIHRFHFWNYMLDLNGNTIPFELYQTPPMHNPTPFSRIKGKVYRFRFDIAENSLPMQFPRERLPSPLDDPHLEDVSHHYFEGTTITIDARQAQGRLLYLGVFNNSMWIPVTAAEIRRGQATFRNLQSGVAWKVLAHKYNELVPISLPFISQEDGSYRFFYPDEVNTQTMRITRKYPLSGWAFSEQHRSVGGLFQGANRADFSDAVLLYKTTEPLGMLWHKVSIDNPRSFRYLRYYSAPTGHCNMAEIRFFSSDRHLTGEVIGTEGASDHTRGRSRYAVFDGVYETFFNAIEVYGAWAGLRLPTPERVTEIEFMFRNDDNNIREGDMYELFYFSENGLVSLGRQIGDENAVLYFYDAPTNAMFWLRNLTRGREERIFTYENGEQVFW